MIICESVSILLSLSIPIHSIYHPLYFSLFSLNWLHN